MSITNIISFIIFVFSLKKLFNLSAKIQAWEKPNRTDHRDSQIQTEEFNGEPISVLHCKHRKEQLNVFKQPTLIYTVITGAKWQGLCYSYLYSCANARLRRFKEAIVSYGMHSSFVKQMLNLWPVCNRIIPKGCIVLVNCVLELCPQLQCRN